jgi:hypothetical protein
MTPTDKTDQLVRAVQRLINAVEAFGGVRPGDIVFDEYLQVKATLSLFKRQSFTVIEGGKQGPKPASGSVGTP